jgi:hypothetical protein
MLELTISLSVTVALCGALLIYTRRHFRKLENSREIVQEVREEINQLVVELNQVTDRNVGIVEDRVASLRTLVSEVDKKIMLLSREREKHGMSTRVYDQLKRSARFAGGGTSDGRPDDATRRDAAEREDGDAASEAGADRRPNGLQTGERGPDSGARRSAPSDRNSTGGLGGEADGGRESGRGGDRDGGSDAGSSGEAGKDVQRGSKQARVLEMYRQGFDAKMIASRLGASLGEVELIISIGERKD